MLRILFIGLSCWCSEQDPQTLSQLLEQLSNSDPSLRESAELALVRHRTTARPKLISLLATDDLDLRGRVQSVLQRMDLEEQKERREHWVNMCAQLTKNMERSRVERVLDTIRDKRVDRRQAVQQHERGDNRIAYDLDPDWQVLVSYSGTTPLQLTSAEVLGFSDLRSQLDPWLYSHVKLVHESPSIQWEGFNAIALIRAVNDLQSMGTDAALRVCEQYDRLVNGPFRTVMAAHPVDRLAVENCYLRTCRYDLDDRRLFLIMRLLFVRRDAEEPLPRLRLGLPSWIQLQVAEKEFPLFPLALQDDFPFLVAGKFSPSEGPEPVLEYLQFCRERCIVRKRPLTPTGVPTDCANRLMTSKGWHLSVLEAHRSVPTAMVRSQALRALESLITEVDDVGRRDDEARWEKQVEVVKRAQPKWDAKRMEFVVSR